MSPPAVDVPPVRYQPFWCEENIWHLVQHPVLTGKACWVVVVTGAEEEVACWQQRAGGRDGFVAWDYHVVLAVAGPTWSIWDLDSQLGFPVPFQAWVAATFPVPRRVPPPYRPRFGLVPGDRWVRDFTSDRSHMRRADGGWQQPPPPWPAIVGGTLPWPAILNQARHGLDLDAFGQFPHNPTRS